MQGIKNGPLVLFLAPSSHVVTVTTQFAYHCIYLYYIYVFTVLNMLYIILYPISNSSFLAPNCLSSGFIPVCDADLG